MTATYQWFIEPQNKITNDALSAELTAEDNFIRNLPDKNGQTHNVWRCDWWLVAYFQRSRKTADLKFKVFNRQSNQRLIRECIFLKKKCSQK